MNDRNMPVTQAVYGKQKRKAKASPPRKQKNPHRTFSIASKLTPQQVSALEALAR